MESVTSANLHRFGDGLLVELVECGEEGDVSVRSFEFESVEADGRTVRPRAALPAPESVMIEDLVIDAGYELATDAPPSSAPEQHRT